MASIFTSVDSVEKLDALIDASHFSPKFLFKHSNSCGISSHIKYQLDSLDLEIFIIIVQDDRPVSNAAAERLRTRHASPQAFILRNGQPVYHATHYGIDPAAIREQFEKAK